METNGPTFDEYADISARLAAIDAVMRGCDPKRHINVLAQLVSTFLVRFPSQDRECVLDILNAAVTTVIPLNEDRLFGPAGHPRNIKTSEPSTAEWKTHGESGVDIDTLVDSGKVVESLHIWHRLEIDGQVVWIDPRPAFCNRGRYLGQYMGTMHVDAADGFPRYFMDLEVAKSEMKAWLLHRMQLERERA